MHYNIMPSVSFITVDRDISHSIRELLHSCGQMRWNHVHYWCGICFGNLGNVWRQWCSHPIFSKQLWKSLVIFDTIQQGFSMFETKDKPVSLTMCLIKWPLCLCCSGSENCGDTEEAAAVHRPLQVPPQLSQPLICLFPACVSRAHQPGELLIRTCSADRGLCEGTDF